MARDELRRELSRLKGALTRAKNSGVPSKIIDECDKAFARFDVIGWPDNWATWQIARDDAMFKLRYEL